MSLELYSALTRYLLTWSYPDQASVKQRKGIRHQARQYEVDGGLLYRRPNKDFLRRKVVTVTEVMRVLKENHDHVMASHQGVARTFDRIKYRYYWPGYYDSVRDYVLSCVVCQNFGPRNPVVTLHPAGQQKEGLFSVISMDYIYLPLTSMGHMGCCKVVCDNGSYFNSDEVKSLMIQSYGTEIRFGIPFHPQGQGKVERTNGILKEVIKKYLLLYNQEWDTWLPAVLYVLRTSLRRDYDYSPFYLVYGRQPRSYTGDGTAEFEASWSDEELVFHRVDEIVRLNPEVIPQALRRVEVCRRKMQDQFNRRAKAKKFANGNQVMVESRDVKNKEAFLLSRWVGPYHVEERVGNNVYKVRDEQLVFPGVYHANQMKLYKARPMLSVPLLFYSGVPAVSE
ncbi:hypothetical protein INT47_004598 [Mucor saturninus]|uniref:Integrase catalytic domain-containing protein n=1 Tax=Mucor saturninus TaxID=64648 RepID=A0A8H7V6F9_9FUNG|nr:hypothetical protein INT47_004598 [Mucor saturninus]